MAHNVASTLNRDERGNSSGNLRDDEVAHIFDHALTELEDCSHLIQDSLIKPTTNLLDMV